MNHLFYILSLIFICFFQNQARAENEPYRPCVPEDVIGTWTMAHQITNATFNPNDPFYFKYQRYRFSEDKTMKHLTANQPITKKEMELEEKAPANRTYEVASDGVIIIRRTNTSDVEVMTCSYITDEKPNSLVTAPHTGDLLLSFFVKQDEPPTLFRLLRREKN